MSEEWDGKERRARGIEQHIQTGLVVIMTTGVVWIASTVASQSATLATLTERVSNMQVQIERLNTKLNADAADRYTISMSKLDQERQRLVDQRQDDRIKALEKK